MACPGTPKTEPVPSVKLYAKNWDLKTNDTLNFGIQGAPIQTGSFSNSSSPMLTYSGFVGHSRAC